MAMSLISMQIFAARVGVKAGCGTAPWKQLRCWYSTRQKKVSHIIRWNTENKMLYGAKQAVTRKNVAGKSTAKGTNKVTKAEEESRVKTMQARRKKEEMKLASVSEAANTVKSFQEDSSREWWHEETTLTEPNKNSSFHTEDAFYNKMLDSGQGYEGSEVSLDSHDTNGVHIPQILPIPPGRTTQKKTVSNPRQKSSSVNSTSSLSDLKQMDFIQHCPLLPSQFEDIRTSAQEFHSFVQSLNIRLLPTVNTVLNKTRSDLSNFFLQRWRDKMIGELGEAGFKKHQEGIIWQGTNLHACVQQYLSGVPVADIQVQDKCRGHWDSICSVLPHVTDVQALETDVSHPWLCYKGTFDCIAKYKNTLYVIDWKTSSKPKPLLSNLYDNPLQVAAYLGAINLSPQLTDQFGVIEQAAIVVAYTNGEEAHVHRISPALCQHYWAEWCQRLHQYWTTVAAERAA